MPPSSGLDPRLSALVVHDLKNRLAILTDELAKLGRLPLPEAAHAHARQANEQALMLTRRLMEFLTVHRAIEQGGLRASPAEEMPDALLMELAADAQMLLHGRLEVVQQFDDNPPFWFYDRPLARLALDSALYNALRFARSRITLGLRVTDGLLCFSVRDDGPGLQDTPASTSTGLGRLVCDEVARAHLNHGRQGRSVLRDHEEGGAVFELFLP
ncbi:HAMP domain-containing histidine kinase [Roseateles sp. DAIF2]|uniref:sensor histidine kinase n=1 Tax=Roseateles sp. DAIF2 TaxID=2714952 RepID=UPI0018A2859F|nr:HAMP domain-containing sensor histidine kinase [Roseateles sp. DAIF2]QPF73719.1 HAMP domain-containing histidine kinase [Roseateles sp. DAIF2]